MKNEKEISIEETFIKTSFENAIKIQTRMMGLMEELRYDNEMFENLSKLLFGFFYTLF